MWNATNKVRMVNVAKMVVQNANELIKTAYEVEAFLRTDNIDVALSSETHPQPEHITAK